MDYQFLTLQDQVGLLQRRIHSLEAQYFEEDVSSRLAQRFAEDEDPEVVDMSVTEVKRSEGSKRIIEQNIKILQQELDAALLMVGDEVEFSEENLAEALEG